MIIGLLGPTNVKKYCDILGFELSEYKYFLEKIAEHLAKTGHEIIIMPSQNQTSQSIVAQTYKDYRGKKVIGIIPMDDTEWGLLDIDEHFADENINCGTWRNQPETFCEKSDILLVIGLSPGAMIELCYTKWFKVEKIYIIKELISGKLHPEIEKDLNVEYISISELEDKIK